MIITCPRCLTKFNFTEETQVFAAEINFRCSRCLEEFVFTPDNDSEAFTDAVAFLSDQVAEPVPSAGKHDMLADADEIELADDFAAFGSGSVDDTEPDVELELDDLELFSATDVGLSDDGSTASLESEVVSGENLTPDMDDTASETEGLASSLEATDKGGVESDIEGDDCGTAPENPIAQHPEDAAAESVTEIQTEPAKDTEDDSGADKPKNSFLLFFGAVLILGLALWFGFSMWQHYALDMEKQLQLVEVSNQRLYLGAGREVVILTGRVVNHSPKLVTDLKIKGVLVDGSGKSVAEVVTTGGVIFSPDELALMDGRELAARGKNEVNLLPAGGELPFMVVFYECPAAAGKCYVEISSFQIKKVE